MAKDRFRDIFRDRGEESGITIETAAIGAVISSVALVALLILRPDHDPAKAAVKRAAVENQAGFLPKGKDCPSGGTPIGERMVVQGTNKSTDPRRNLVAIQPERMYVIPLEDGTEVKVYCGPYYGANGPAFEGDAAVPYPPGEDNHTLISRD